MDHLSASTCFPNFSMFSIKTQTCSSLYTIQTKCTVLNWKHQPTIPLTINNILDICNIHVSIIPRALGSVRRVSMAWQIDRYNMEI